MKPLTLHEDVKHEGNLTDFGVKVRMEISDDADDRLHLMSVLTNMYSDRVLACIREYSTNARDANLMAGNGDKPIEVSLPGALSQYFKVKDYGPGLDVDDIRDTYSRYGKSKKRDSDDFNGVLGIGAKAALTYTSAFTITSVKNGTRYVVSVTTNEDGVGEMTILDTRPTTEPNGTEVTIPVRNGDVNEFNRKALSFFHWWEPGTVRGVARNSINPIDTFGNISTYDRSVVPRDLILMGGVAYPVPYDGGLADFERSFSIVYTAKMGEVQFAPNREALMRTSRVKKAVDGIRETFAARLAAEWQAKVTKDTTPVEALAVKYRADKRYPKMDIPLTYKGKTIPTLKDDVFNCPTVTRQVKDWKGNLQFKLDGTGNVTTEPKMETVKEFFHILRPIERTDEQKAESFYFPDVRGYLGNEKARTERTLIVLGAPKEVSKHHRSLVRQYDRLACDGKTTLANTSGYNYYFFTHKSALPGEGWLEGMPFVTWNEIKSDIRNATVARVKRNKEKFPVVYPDGTEGEVAIDPKAKVVFTTPAVRRERGIQLYTLAKSAKEMGYEPYLVAIDRGRHKKFESEFPNAKEVFTALREGAKSWYDGLTNEEVKALHVVTHHRAPAVFQIRGIQNHLDELDDRELVDAFNEYERIKAIGMSLHPKYTAHRNMAVNAVHGREDIAQAYMSTLQRWDRIYGDFLPTHYNASVQNIVTVANALFHYRKETK